MASSPCIAMPKLFLTVLLAPSAPIKYLHSNSMAGWTLSGKALSARTVADSGEYVHPLTLYPLYVLTSASVDP